MKHASRTFSNLLLFESHSTEPVFLLIYLVVCLQLISFDMLCILTSAHCRSIPIQRPFQYQAKLSYLMRNPTVCMFLIYSMNVMEPTYLQTTCNARKRGTILLALRNMALLPIERYLSLPFASSSAIYINSGFTVGDSKHIYNFSIN